MDTTVFEKSSIMKSTVQGMFDFHNAPEIFQKISPPGVIVQIHEDNRTSLTEGDLKFTLWMGFIPIRWHARHQPGPTEHSFADLMVSGPMAYWLHQHIFEEAEGGVKLITA